MITRVTHQSTQRMSLANMQANLAKMSDLQSQASSGKLINKASDDPAKAAEAMALRKEQRATEQYARNAQDGVSWLNTVDSAIQSSVDFMQRARDLTVQGANTGAIGLLVATRSLSRSKASGTRCSGRRTPRTSAAPSSPGQPTGAPSPQRPTL